MVNIVEVMNEVSELKPILGFYNFYPSDCRAVVPHSGDSRSFVTLLKDYYEEHLAPAITLSSLVLES